MSFRYYADKVRDSSLPINRRASALRSCALRLAWLLRQKRSEILGPLEDAYLGPDSANWSGQNLLRALHALQTNRDMFLSRLRAFEERRVREKRQGRRKPTASELEELFGYEVDVTL